MKHYLLFCSLALISCVLGCNPTPPELADLSPVAITVVNGDVPVPNVRVSLSSTDADSRIWSCGGLTNTSGVATITSSLRKYTKNGARPGSYKVTLVQSVSLPPELQPTEAEADAAISAAQAKILNDKRNSYIEKNRVVPPALEDLETTPIKLAVTKNTPMTFTVDITKY